MKQVRGLTRFGRGGESYVFSATAAIAAPDAVPAATEAGLGVPYAGDRVVCAGVLGRFGSTQLYLDFLDAQGVPLANGSNAEATVTAWRILESGEIVQGSVFAGLKHRVLARDEDVSGRRTLYQITAVANAGGAVALSVHVAGEGLGHNLTG